MEYVGSRNLHRLLVELKEKTLGMVIVMRYLVLYCLLILSRF